MLQKINILPDCVVPENIHTPTTEGIGNSEGDGGSKEIPEGRGGCMIELVSRGIPVNQAIQKSFLTY